MVANVFLTTQAGSSPGDSCATWLPVDWGSEGFILHAHDLDDAARALAAVPDQGVSPKQACAYAAASTPSKVEMYEFQYDGLTRHTRSVGDLHICDQKIRDGSGFLHPAFVCNAFRPYCFFGMASGDTTVPETELRLWFDVTNKRLTALARASL